MLRSVVNRGREGLVDWEDVGGRCFIFLSGRCLSSEVRHVLSCAATMVMTFQIKVRSRVIRADLGQYLRYV